MTMEGGNAMTTIEFIAQKLKKAKLALESQSKKPNVTPLEIQNLTEKVNHYQIILEMLQKNCAE